MSLHRFDIATLAATPWKNGGGSTREIVCRPPGASMDSFDWRASIATIDRPGPFSAFAGVDRSIMLLTGAGVTLRSRDGSIHHALDTPLAPFAFSGDVALDCALPDGTSTDFNVMTRRGRRHADVRVCRAAASLPPGPAGLLLALNGSWRLRNSTGKPEATGCTAGTGLWWDGADHGWRADPEQDGAVLIAVRIEPRPRIGPPSP